MRNIPIIFALLFLCPFFSQAQDKTFYHYGLEEGLSQETIRCILKDSKGFLWLGTQDGLNKFDGTAFTVYKNHKKDSLSISGNFINDLVEDDDNIWIGTNDNGISIYNSHLNSFKQTLIKKGNCSSISKMSDGTIIATVLNQGLVIFKKEKASYSTFKITELNGERLQFTLSSIHNDKIYVITDEDRIFVIDNILDTNKIIKEIKLDSTIGIINVIHVQDDILWMGTSDGLFALNQKKNTLKKVALQSDKASDKFKVESIKTFNGVFYLGTFNGLFLASDFNSDTFTFKNIITYKGEQNHRNSITSNRVYDTFTDGNLLWVGTNNLDVVSLNDPVFKNINSTSKTALNNSFILSLAKNSEYTFVGTRKGINCINSNGEVTQITTENTNNSLAFNVIRAMSIDQNNNLWVATLKGVSVINLDGFNPKKPKIISIYNDEENSASLSANSTRGIYKDHNNALWIATYGGGLSRFTGNLKTNTITFKNYKSTTDANSISSNFTYSMSQDKDLNYWITSENGLTKLEFEGSNYSQPKFTKYFHNIDDENSLSSNVTLHTWHDKNDILWIATQDGFNKFNPQNNTFKRYGQDDGLTNTFVYSITEDKTNHLWLTTNDGIFKFNKDSEKFTNYNQRDGVQSSEFNLGAHYYNKATNEIYVGGIGGFNIFEPSRVSELDIEGELTFISLRIKDEDINPANNSSVLKESITKTKEITLNHKDFPCYISFSDLDLRPYKNNQFIYTLNDNEWNDLRDTREIQLLELPKGNHLLQIQGKSRNKIWNKPPLQLNIRVIPPWYKSNIAYGFYILTFLVLAYLFYRLSLQKQIAGQETKRLQELDDLKSRFITNITHEFRTPLTIIMGYVDTLKNNLSDDEVYIKPIKSIEKNSNNLLTLINEMMDLASLEQGNLVLNITQQDIVPYTKYLTDSFSSLAESKSITINFNSEVKTQLMDFDIEKYRQIITNLISNAIKFSEADSKIKVLLTVDQTKHIQIKVSDEGKGIPEAELPFIFDRFYQATTNSYKKNRGTGIGLALTKELVQLMKGKITVASKNEKGTTFSIVIPITNNAELKNQTSQIKAQQVSPNNFEDLEENIKNSDLPTVLVVEDNKEIAHYIGTCLTPSYNVQYALNGQIGFDMAETLIPDIVITDVMMPIMDGYELTDKLQNTKATNHIPIIILTAKAQQDDKIFGLRSGADAYLTKPFQKKELLVRINALIEKRHKLQERYSLKKIISIDTSSIKADKNLDFLDSIIQHIHKNIENSDYNAPKLAADVFMSESQLYRKLKAITNKSSAIFIRSVRLEKAKELLQTTTLSVSEVAYTTGFSNPNWFGKAFKEEFGMNPSEIKS